MKNQIIFALAIVASLMIRLRRYRSSSYYYSESPFRRPMTIIRSVYPSAGAPGTTVAIFGENFGPTSSYNFVTFGSVSADITSVGAGIINVLVPENLPAGDYTIHVNAEGQLSSAPSMFTVTSSPY